MLTTTLRRVGGSVMMALPRRVLELLDLEAGSEVRLAIEGGRLLVERPTPRYSLAELLAETDPEQRTAEEHEWLEAPPVGRELI